jgi:hypothetical protein
VRPSVVVLAALSVALVLPAGAEAKRRVPYGFFGMTWDLSARHAPRRARNREWSKMARSGVESVRVSFSWNQAQPFESGPENFGPTDDVVYQAARHGIHVLPVVESAPLWAARYPDRKAAPPNDDNEFVNFLTDLAYRYGPGGFFWDEHPRLPYRPIHEWQIWNEPERGHAWQLRSGGRGDWPDGYTHLLEISNRAVKLADPDAVIVMAGVANDSWNKIRQLYQAGGGRWFDVAAYHLYTRTGRHTVRAAQLVRAVMRRYGDRRKPLWATEVGCPAAKGRRGGRGSRLATTDRGMARCLRDIYRGLARKRRRLRVGRVYWYTWGTNYSGSRVFDYSGLRAWSRRRHTFRSKPALRQYVLAARRYEGCVKTARGRCRRRHR